MANYSYTDITLSGSEEDILFAETELKKHTIDDRYLGVSRYIKDDNNIDQRAGYGSAEILNITVSDDTIELSLSGRWCSPHLYFEDLVKRHNLSGEYADSEEGCDFFYLMIFENGIKTEEINVNYFSQASIDYYGIDQFTEHYSWIAEEDDWENNNDATLKLFADNGYPIEELKELWL